MVRIVVQKYLGSSCGFLGTFDEGVAANDRMGGELQMMMMPVSQPLSLSLSLSLTHTQSLAITHIQSKVEDSEGEKFPRNCHIRCKKAAAPFVENFWREFKSLGAHLAQW